MRTHTADFFLVGDREYVQGTQMIARGADIIRATCGEHFSLTTAAFKRITSNNVVIAEVVADEDAPSASVGYAVYDGDQGRQLLHFLDSGVIAQRTDEYRSGSCTLARSARDLTGSFVYSRVTSFEGMLSVVIRCLKLLHQALPGNVRDIWFTGCRHASLPVRDPFPANQGGIEIEHLRLMRTPSRCQTLSQVKIVGDSEVPASAVFSITYQSD